MCPAKRGKIAKEPYAVRLWIEFYNVCPDYYLGSCIKKDDHTGDFEDCEYKTCPKVLKAKEGIK